MTSRMWCPLRPAGERGRERARAGDERDDTNIKYSIRDYGHVDGVNRFSSRYPGKRMQVNPLRSVENLLLPPCYLPCDEAHSLKIDSMPAYIEDLAVLVSFDLSTES